MISFFEHLYWSGPLWQVILVWVFTIIMAIYCCGEDWCYVVNGD